MKLKPAVTSSLLSTSRHDLTPSSLVLLLSAFRRWHAGLPHRWSPWLRSAFALHFSTRFGPSSALDLPPRGHLACPAPLRSVLGQSCALNSLPPQCPLRPPHFNFPCAHYNALFAHPPPPTLIFCTIIPACFFLFVNTVVSLGPPIFDVLVAVTPPAGRRPTDSAELQ